PGAAVPGQVHAEQPQFSRLAGQLQWYLPGLVPVGDVRADAVGGEASDGLLDGPLFVGEQVVDAEQLQRSGHWCSPRTRRTAAFSISSSPSSTSWAAG